MTDLVNPNEIEEIVGVKRDPLLHWGRAVSAEQTVYILHSQECVDSGIDLRDCAFSKALDKGINPNKWVEDCPVVLMRLTTMAVDEDSLVQTVTELVPDGDAFSGLNEAEWARFKVKRAELLEAGFVDLPELVHPLRHPDDGILRVGTRVHHRGERYYEALRVGTGIVLALMEHPNSTWSKKYGERDIELLVLTDKDRFDTGNRIASWANYHTRLPIGDLS